MHRTEALRITSHKPREYIHTHTALRGVAAFLVVAYHLQFGAAHRLAIETATPFFERGYLLVDLFFILSGFIISYTREEGSLHAMSKGETYAFYVARLARVYPLHLFCLVANVILTLSISLGRSWHHSGRFAATIDHAAARSFVEESLLLQAWIPGAPRWNIPSWSISAEVFAYLVFPFILLLRHHLPRLTTCLMLAGPLAFYSFIVGGNGSLDIIAGLAPLRCLAGFIIGVLLCEHRQAVTRWRGPVIALCQLVAIAGIAAVLATRCYDPLVIPFFALLVIATWQDRGPLRFLFVRRALLRAGELSYSVYLVHVGVIALALPVWYALVARVPVDPDVARLAYVVATFMVIVVVSRWTHGHVETTGRRAVRRFFDRQC